MTLPSTSRSQLNLLLRSALKHSAGDERGSNLVETAISMVVMFMLLFGVIEAGWAVYSFHFVANAAHDATRYAVVRGNSWGTNCDVTGQAAGSGYASSRCLAVPADIANYVASLDFPGVNIAASNVCVEYFSAPPASTSTSCSGNSSPNAPGDIVQVTITYPFTLTIPGLPQYSVNLSSTSQSVIAQ